MPRFESQSPVSPGYLHRGTTIDTRALVDGDVIGGDVQLVDVELIAPENLVASLPPLLGVVQLQK